MENSSSETEKKDDPEDARVGYEVASNYAILFTESFWSIFNAMLVANSVVVAGLSIAFGNNGAPEKPQLKTFLLIIGLVLCLVWFLLIQRHREISTYYTLSAREIEEHFFSKRIKTLSRGGDFADGKKVKIDLARNKKIWQLSPAARFTRGKTYSYVIVLVFVAFYIAFFFS